MAQPPNNPPNDQDAAGSRRGLRLARLVIALGLFVGIAVFAAFTFIELWSSTTNRAAPVEFGALDPASTAPLAQAQGPNPLAGVTGTDPSKFIPILRENPHPGEIEPFQRCDPFGQPPYRQPSTGGEVWEFCVYQVADASLTDLIAHYDRQANRRGMRLARQKPTSANMPGGLVASWTDGRHSLQVTAMPQPVTVRVQPPLAPPTPLRWVVKYSYPDPTPRP